MSNTAQLVELEGGQVGDRPWGQTFAGYARDKLSGQIAVVEGDRTFVVAFAQGTVVGARSPLATDAAVRVARLANLISPTQVSSFVRAHGASPIGDDVDLLAAHAKMSREQTAELRRKVIAHRAARTFSLEAGKVMVEPQASIDVVAGDGLDPRAIIYLGARQNVSEQRLATELARMGTWFKIPDAKVPEVPAFGFGEAERVPLERLRAGCTLTELELCAPGIETRLVRALVYTLCVTGTCEAHGAKPSLQRRVVDSVDPGQLLAPRPEVEGLLAPKPIDNLDDLMSEHADLPAPQSADLLRPVEGRERTDTVLDTHNKVDLVGVTIDNRYVLERKLGEGAMGAVYLAHHTKLDRMFAVKVLHRRLLANAKSRRRFEREAELTGRLSHDHVVRVVDVGTVHDLPYLAMEFAEGASLASVMVDAPLPAARATTLLRQLCGGLHHAHEAGVIHRDLKPSNVIVDTVDGEDHLRIVDFGIAILDEPEGNERLTTRGVVLGTPDYMAPELALGKQIDHRLDLYALGVIAYELFTGERPFAGDGVDVALANVNSPVPPMRERAPSTTVDPLHEALVRALLEKDPKSRPADAQEVRRLLDLIEKDRRSAATVLGVSRVDTTPNRMPALARPTAPAPTEAPPSAPATDAPADAMTDETPSTDEPRAAIKTRAMWQLKREAMPALGTSDVTPGQPTTMRVAAVPPAIQHAPAHAVDSAIPTPVAKVDTAPLPTVAPSAAPVGTDAISTAPIANSSVTVPASGPTARPFTFPAGDRAYVPDGGVRVTERMQGPPLPPLARPPMRIGSGTRTATHSIRTEEIRPIGNRWVIVAGVAVAVFVVIVIVAIATSRRSDAPVESTERPMERVKAPAPPTLPPAKPSNTVKPKTPASASSKPAANPDTSTRAIANLYGSVGRELTQLHRLVGESLTADLMARYRVIQFQSAVQTEASRAAAHEVLSRLQRDVRAVRDASKTP